VGALWEKACGGHLTLFPSLAVIALDNNPTRLALARHNALQYGVADRIEFILCDFVSFAQALVRSAAGGKAGPANRPLHGIDSVFLSPPWGGISYLSLKTNPANLSTPTQEIAQAATGLTPDEAAVPDADAPDVYPLAALAPLHGKELFGLARAITRDVAYYLPKNADLAECAALADEGETVEVEEEWMGGKLKAITLLYGALAGQAKAQ
jgi:trimethylguanosine synthase